jgi:hypothetical protein
MKKHDPPGSDEHEEDVRRDEHAYEDSWYRSLKALAERTAQSDDESDEQKDHGSEPAGDEALDSESPSRH